MIIYDYPAINKALRGDDWLQLKKSVCEPSPAELTEPQSVAILSPTPQRVDWAAITKATQLFLGKQMARQNPAYALLGRNPGGPQSG